MVPWATRVNIPNGITIGSASFCKTLSISTVRHVRHDWQTDRPRSSICGNRPHLTSAATRPKSSQDMTKRDVQPSLLMPDTPHTTQQLHRSYDTVMPANRLKTLKNGWKYEISSQLQKLYTSKTIDKLTRRESMSFSSSGEHDTTLHFTVWPR